MELMSSQIEPVELTETSEKNSWDRERSIDELRSFITSREVFISQL